MGIRWLDFIARFKIRLNLTDLERVTEDLFEAQIKGINSDLYKALLEGNISVDHETEWRVNFVRILERIASRATRKSQAAECRKAILDVIETNSLLARIFATDEKETRETLMACTFFPDSTERGRSGIMRLGATQYFYRLTDGGALAVLYHSQFNSALQYDSFATAYARDSN